MQENEFEKQVQQKMEELKLDPSAEVWTEVERRIRKEKKRRFIFWWWPLFFLLLGGGIVTGIWFSNEKGINKTGFAGNKSETGIQQQGAVKNDHTPKTITPLKINKTGSKEEVFNRDIIKKSKNKLLSESDKDKTGIAVLQYAPKQKNRKTLRLLHPKKNDENDEKIADQTPGKGIKPGMKDKTVDMLNSKSNEELLTNRLAKTDNSITERIETENEPSKIKWNTVVQKSDSVENQTTQKKAESTKKHWDWGLTFSAGRSVLSKGLDFSNKSLYADALSQQNASQSPGSMVNDPASLIRPSFSWSAGLYIKKQLSGKLEIKLGPGYSYLSTRINTGTRVDSVRNISTAYSSAISVNRFYRPAVSGNSSSYTNDYHFIGLSGTISWQIITWRKLKLYWENSLTYNRLVGSAMLHYDYNLPGYYKDNNLLIKNQFMISTGVSVPVSQRVMINPFAAYGLSPVLIKSGNPGAHYTNLGIRVNLLLKKNN